MAANNNMLWINFLHFYQPATLDREIIIEAIEKSYQRIIQSLKKHGNAKITINIQGCLLEKINELGYASLLRDIKTLIQKGQIEITGSAAYHPILPLINSHEAEKQIKLQEQIIKKYFGEIKLTGFFMPEMAYSAASAKLIKKLGYEWIMLDEISGSGKIGALDCSRPYMDNDSGLKIIFRQREISQTYVPQKISEIILNEKNKTIITATDAELYGLRHIDVSGHFGRLLSNPDIKTVLISDFTKDNNNLKKITLIPSSWESTSRELNSGLPYALWYNKKNKIQKKIWQLADMAMEASQRYKNDPQKKWAQWHLNRGLASCTFWWASGKKISLWNNLSWNPDEIERGVEELIKSIRALDDIVTRPAKIKAEKLYIKIKKIIWKRHWGYFWKK